MTSHPSCHGSAPSPQIPSRTPPNFPLGPATCQTAKKYANVTTWVNVLGATTASSPITAGDPVARVSTLAKGAPKSEPQRAITPLRHSQFEKELAHHPDKAWSTWLLKSLNEGVSLGYDGPRGPSKAPNLASSYTHPQIVTSEIQKECDLGRILGPFPQPPIPNLKCSGVGVVPKKSGKWRMIQHLSAPQGSSVNDHIRSEDFPVHYSSVDDAIACLIHLGPGALMAKIDLKSAFRMIPVRRADWELLGIHWQGSYYVDTCLPFGLRSAPYLFNQYAEALHWILQNNYQLSHLIHYLDDYLLMGPPRNHQCQKHLCSFLATCTSLGIPVAMDKLEGPSTTLTFLGLELDSVAQEIRLPQPKRDAILEELHTWSSQRYTTKRKLLSLIGLLNFAARAVPAGRLFIRRLITLSTKAKRLHHRIRVNGEARADIQWWKSFMPEWNGRAFFLEPNATNAHDLSLYTDAAGAVGCGAYFRGQWFHHSWEPHQTLSGSTSIQWQELFAIVAAALTWGHLWSRKRIRFFCDNQAVVQVWQGKSSRHPRLMDLLRRLFFTAAQYNFSVSLKHVPGTQNTIADALSRKKFKLFFALAPQAQKNPTTTPGLLNTL